MKEFIGLLNFLGWQPNETMQYGFRHPDGKREWYRNRLPEAVRNIGNMIAADLSCDMWYGINPVSRDGEGRAKSSEVMRVVSAYLDLDFKPGGLRTEKNAIDLVAKMQEALETDNLAAVHTGGGLQVYFPLSDEKSNDVIGARFTIKRVELLAQSIAHQLNLGSIDSVADLTRVFRIPGSKNLKYTDKPEVFRVGSVIGCEQEDTVKWLRLSELPAEPIDQQSSETSAKD